MAVCVLLADVVGSSRLSDAHRRQLDDLLRRLFGEFNRRFKAELSAPFDTTVGDEFEAVFRHPAAAVKPAFLSRAWLAVYSKQFFPELRTALGVGEAVVTGTRVPRRQDGPAFHSARRLMERLKQEKRFSGIECDAAIPLAQMANDAFEAAGTLIDSLQERWTTAQWQAAYWRWHSKSLEDIGEELGIAHQNVHKRLAAARFDAIDHALDCLLRTLDEVVARTAVPRRRREQTRQGE